MTVDEREIFCKNEIEALKSQEQELEAAKQSGQLLPTVKEETQLESQPENNIEVAGDGLSSNVNPDATSPTEVVKKVTENNVDGGVIDDKHYDMNADGDIVEGSPVYDENIDEEKTIDTN